MPNTRGVGSPNIYAVTVEDLEKCRRRIFYYAANQQTQYDPYFCNLIATLHRMNRDGFYTHELTPQDHAVIHWAMHQIGP